MKRFAVEYYRKSGNVLKEVIARETIRAVNINEAREIADMHKPNKNAIYDIKDITAVY